MGCSKSSSSCCLKSIRIVNTADRLTSDIISKLSYHSIIQSNCVGKNTGLQHAFLLVEFSDGTFVRAEIGKDCDSNISVFLENYNPKQHQRPLNGQSYNVIDGKIKWSDFLDEVTIYRRKRPMYQLFSNNCYDFVHCMLQRFAADYRGECEVDNVLQQTGVAAGLAIDAAALIGIGLAAAIH